MSFGLIWFNSISIPSTKINGLDVFNVPVPRIEMFAFSSLGFAPVVITFKPAAIPESAFATVVTGRESAWSSKSTVDTEPVRLTFFCVP